MQFQVTRTDGTDNSGKLYLVVNVDEPYAGQVADLIEAEERRKGTWDHGDKTMREVMGVNNSDVVNELKRLKNKIQAMRDQEIRQVYHTAFKYSPNEHFNQTAKERQSMLGWIDGAPPEVLGQDKVLIVVELPSRFSGLNVVSYRCISWNGESWSDKEAFRARRWITIPLPPTTVS